MLLPVWTLATNTRRFIGVHLCLFGRAMCLTATQGRLISFLQNIDQMHYELRHLSEIATRPLLALLMSMHGFFFYGRYFTVIFVNLLIILTYRYEITDEYESGNSAKFESLIDPGATAEVARGPCVYFNFICYVYLLIHLSIIDGLPIIRSRLRSAVQIDNATMRWVLFRDCSLSLGLDMKGPFHVIQCIISLFSHTRFFILCLCCVLCLYAPSFILTYKTVTCWVGTWYPTSRTGFPPSQWHLCFWS